MPMETLILKPSKAKWFGVSLIGLLFTAGGILMIKDGQGLMAWFVTLFFGAVAAIGLYNMISSDNYLKLDAHGFEQRMMGRSLKVPWSDIVDFGLVRVAGNTFVTFTQASYLDTRIGKFNKNLVGATSQLSDNFGMKPRELAELMATYWQAAKDQDTDYPQ